jgi:hypothetical protein
LLCIFLITPITGRFIPIEFANTGIRDRAEESRFFAVPVLIAIILFSTIKYADTALEKILKVISALGAAFLVMIIMGMSALAGMCSWSNGEVLYQHRLQKGTRIVVRYYGCGATDSGSPTKKICTISQITPFFIRVAAADTTGLDPEIWQRVFKD